VATDTERDSDTGPDTGPATVFDLFDLFGRKIILMTARLPRRSAGIRLAAWSILIRRQRAYRQAETPPIVLCRFSEASFTPWLALRGY
jgi:hypothetical protein